MKLCNGTLDIACHKIGFHAERCLTETTQFAQISINRVIPSPKSHVFGVGVPICVDIPDAIMPISYASQRVRQRLNIDSTKRSLSWKKAATQDLVQFTLVSRHSLLSLDVCIALCLSASSLNRSSIQGKLEGLTMHQPLLSAVRNLHPSQTSMSSAAQVLIRLSHNHQTTLLQVRTPPACRFSPPEFALTSLSRSRPRMLPSRLLSTLLCRRLLP